MTLEQVLDADLTSAPLAPLPPSGNATLGGEGSPAARRLLNFYSISEPVVSGPIRRW